MLPMARGQVAMGGYDVIDPYHMLGARPASMVGPQPEGAAGLTAGTSSLMDRHGDKPWHPDSGLFWFGMLLATTMGLIGASTAVRVGPFKGALSAGKS